MILGKVDKAFTEAARASHSMFPDIEEKLGKFILQFRKHIGSLGSEHYDEAKKDSDIAKVLEAAENAGVSVLSSSIEEVSGSESLSRTEELEVEAEGYISQLYSFYTACFPHLQSLPYHFGKSLWLPGDKKNDLKLLEDIGLCLWLGAPGLTKELEEGAKASEVTYVPF